MSLYEIRVYHNTESRFGPYRNGHRLTATVSHHRDLAADTRPEEIAEWTFRVLNADLDDLEYERTVPGGEVAFLIACVYRLLRLRSLSVGDVLHITTGEDGWWLACDPFGWRHVTPPANLHGQPLTADTVYQHCARQEEPQ